MNATIDSLRWMSGHWRRADAGSVQEEVWLAPLGGAMLGMDRDVRSDGKVLFEHMRIQEEDGTVVFHASLQGRAPIAFRLTAAGENDATFEREGDAFPARIRYWRRDRVLHCRIDGGGRELEWNWPLASAPAQP
jgi:hypothetical protein